MNSKDCLTEQDLTLHYYGELDESRRRHLAGCQRCTERLATLTAELAGLPIQDCTPDALAGARMAARVNEALTSRRRKSWLPALGAGARRDPARRVVPRPADRRALRAALVRH